jgi:hypothetical protein
MFWFYKDVFCSFFTTILLVVIPLMNGISCCILFKRILNKIMIGTLLSLVTSYLNFWLYYVFYCFLCSINIVDFGSESLGIKVMTVIICGGFTFCLYKIGFRKRQKSKTVQAGE